MPLSRSQKNNAKADPRRILARYDRDALVAACGQCGVICGVVECESSIADGFVAAQKIENGVGITKKVPAQWVMTNSRDALIYTGD